MATDWTKSIKELARRYNQGEIRENCIQCGCSFSLQEISSKGRCPSCTSIAKRMFQLDRKQYVPGSRLRRFFKQLCIFLRSGIFLRRKHRKKMEEVLSKRDSARR